MNVETRIRWRPGNELEIFSISQNKWFKGVIDKINVEDGIEWLTITYDNGDYEKIVDRMDFNSLRPIKLQTVGIDFFEYEKNINKIVNILDRNKDGVIDLKELQAFYPDTAKALFMELDIDGSCNLSVWELKTKINTNEIAIMVLNKLKHIQKYQHSLGPLNVAPQKQLPHQVISTGVGTQTSSSSTPAATLPSFIKQHYHTQPHPHMATTATALTPPYNYILHPGTTFTPSVASPVPIGVQSVSQYPVPEYQEYLVKKLKKENEQLKDALRMERTEKKMKIAEIEQLKKFIKTLKNKMVTAIHKKDLQINNVKHIIHQKNQSLETLQSELNLKIKERYIELKSLRNTINYQQAHITKFDGIKKKLKTHLIKHFNNEFTKRDEEIKHLQFELDKNKIYSSHVSSSPNNNNNQEYISKEMDQIKLKINQEIAQKNKIIFSLQNSLSKMKKEIEVQNNERDKPSTEEKLRN